MVINYKTYEFQCYEHIRRMEDLLRSEENYQEISQWRLEAERLRGNLESRRFRMVVVGEFNRGKTSFVNALLGKEILPADYMPTTAAINRITYGDTPSACILLRDGRKEYVQITELAGYMTKLSAAAGETASNIEEAVVEYPSLFCRNGVDLLDTPGMNDEESMNRVTLSCLEDIDLAIVAVHASMPFSMTERAFTAQLLESPQICQIIIVVTKIDTIRPSEREKLIQFMTDRVKSGVREYLEQKHTEDDPIMRKYHDIFDNPYVFAVSSLDALDALAQNDMELFEKSGFLRLNNELPQIILNSQNSNVIFNSLRTLRGLIHNYWDWLAERRRKRNIQIQTLESSIIETIGKFRAQPPDPDGEVSYDFDQCHAAARKCFIQALSQMQTLRYDELQKALSPAVREAFQTVGAALRTQEAPYLDAYQDKLRRAGAACAQEIGLLTDPFPALRESLQPELEDAANSFSILENTPTEAFYWVCSPIPDRHAIGSDWQVMPFIDAAIQSSLQSYQIRRKKEFERFSALLNEHLSNQLPGILARIRGKIQRYAETIPREREQAAIDALQVLEGKCQNLLNQFQTELQDGKS